MARELGAVVLGYGAEAAEHLKPLLESLAGEGLDAEDVTVVWNPGGRQSDFTSPVERVTTIRAPHNLGYAGGMNLGIRDQLQKERSLLLLLTQDVRLEPGAVGRLRSTAAQAPAFGVLGPELRWSGTGQVTFGIRWSARGKVDHVHARPDDADGDGVVESDAIDGAVVLLKAKVLADIGLLHDNLFMYFEETELCLRAKRAGWRVGVVLGAVAEQSPGGVRRPGAFNYLMARNGLEFALLLAGWRGVLAALGRDIAQSWRLMKMRFSPKSDTQRRWFATVSLVGLWLGVLAFGRRRWGPPPENLPGLGDMQLTAGELGRDQPSA